ncbi:MAG: hypothetical protein A2270_04455 [Elusimicrobia bacterium RIFOXYA12_FULL_51_18]|nr:MAG: hypothetical protein A2270_04455 [Elusimicrobia bacterium RIFOXYA12_FULL_51_18]OGS32828.1 MAG: hypothetical protein A2218_10510 [Elusimicrobia bacterium RIFOXYA2_FULL_53_38]
MPGPKSKILIITERFYPEEFIINDLAGQWAERGFETEVLTQVPSYPFGRVFQGYVNRFYSEELWRNIRVRRFFTITGYRDSLALKILNYFSFIFTGSLIALFIAGRYDRIFVYQTGPLTVALPAVLAGLARNKPVTIWTQDVWPDTVYAYGFKKTGILSWFLDKLVAFIYRNCAQIFVSCEGFREKILQYAPGRRIYHFPNWPTIAPSGETLVSPVKMSDKFNFTFAGNIGKVQNLENVIRGFGLASAQNSGIQLNIIGDGSNLERLKELVTDGKINNVVFWGRKRQSEMPAYFNASDVMVVSLNDDPVFNITVPAKFQAYLAFSKPVFCVMNGEVRRIVEKYKTGLCSAPGDLNGINEGFLKFYALKDGGLQTFAGNSKVLLETVYDRTRITEAMSSLLEADLWAEAEARGN